MSSTRPVHARLVALTTAGLLAASLAAATPTSAVGTAQQRAGSASITFGTYNIQKPSSSRPWGPRRTKVASLLRDARPDVFGIQEANGPHKGPVRGFPARDLDAQLSAYAIVRTRDDRGTRALSTTGRYIFYRTARFTPGRNGEIALGSGSFAVWSELTDRSTGGRFVFVDAHLVNGNTAARDRVRRAQTRRLVARTRAANRSALPVVYAGDLNTHRDHVSDAPTAVLRAAGSVNTYDVARTRVKASYSSSNQLRRKPPRKYLHADYVWVPRGSTVSRWAQAIRLRDGRFVGTIPSDHHPVFASVRLPHQR
ncbi:MAG: endonuclease/exonuclease/phosphatase family protein [Nocardioidaceae bacterium]|nr:endonuclease/exonuclease/phosphatase family protein [Nocardioidaceae bacterium]